MKRFEYKVITSYFRLERKLNQLGYDGWEAVAGTGNCIILKREYND